MTDGAIPRIATLTVMRSEIDQLMEMLPTVEWADECHIVETGQDSTATAGVAPGARVHHVPLPLGATFDAARSAALPDVIADWILVVDTDERVPVELAKVLRMRAEEWSAAGLAGVWIPRLNHVFDRPLRYSSVWPDYQLRFMRRDAVSFSPTLHSAASVVGPTHRLAAQERYAIRHHSFRSTAQFLEKVNLYTSIEASQSQAGQKASPAWAVAASAREFLARYVKMKGYRDGAEGLHHAVMWAIYRYLVGSKVWEATRPGHS